MRNKAITAVIMAGAISIFAVGAVAQHEEHHALGQASQDQSKPGMTGPGMMGQQGMGGMMNMMGQMSNHHQQMSELMNKLMQSMSAIQNEKDPEALKSKLAEHNALIKQMHDQMAQQGTMMQNMSGMMKSCPMMGDDTKPTPK